MRTLNFICLLLGFYLFSLPAASADQLAWISKAQAETAVAYLKKEKQVILFCGCCDADQMEKIKIQEVTYRIVDAQQGYYQVFVTALYEGKVQEIPLDLAYVHIKEKKKAQCLGKVLGFECDPCVAPFYWKIAKNKY
ncbi:MAG: hypothetical protein ACFB0B_05395 [Thermonemataceae bacterium]